jgi:hypothetical protein
MKPLPFFSDRIRSGITLVPAIMLFSLHSLGQLTQTFTSGGSFTIPSFVTTITVQAWGGGGGGSNISDPSGGGGGGAFAGSTLTSLIPGSVYAVTVGDGGAIGNAGGSSGFGSEVIALGGSSPVAPTGRLGALGGSASGSTGTTKWSGGNGGDGHTGNGDDGGGGGGGSAYPTANGGDAGSAVDPNGSTGGAGGAGTGAGGRGANFDGTPDAEPGSAPGGGGGGRGNAGTSKPGAPGQVIVSWVPPFLDQHISMDFGSSNWCAGETRTVSVRLQNTGQATWTDASPEINIGLKWDADPGYLLKADAGGLVPGATQTYSFQVTAPSSAGTTHLTCDVIKEGDCQFGNNDGTCGPGNTAYVSGEITIRPNPAFSATPANVTCYAGSNGQITVTASGGTGPWSYSTDNGVNYAPDASNPHTFTGLLPATYKVRVKDSFGCQSVPCP